MPLRYRLLLLVGAAAALAWWLVNRGKQNSAREALTIAGAKYGIPSGWLVALGLTETDLDPSAVNDTGPDRDRGGSWGVTQISARTARAFGYTGPMATLTEDVNLAAELTAQMVSAGFAERSSNKAAPESGPFKPIYYGMPQTFEDMLSIWNAGRLYSELDPGNAAQAGTLATYIPRGQDALAQETGSA
jgi:hypothetical protein